MGLRSQLTFKMITNDFKSWGSTRIAVQNRACFISHSTSDVTTHIVFLIWHKLGRKCIRKGAIHKSETGFGIKSDEAAYSDMRAIHEISVYTHCFFFSLSFRMKKSTSLVTKLLAITFGHLKQTALMNEWCI